MVQLRNTLKASFFPAPSVYGLHFFLKNYPNPLDLSLKPKVQVPKQPTSTVPNGMIFDHAVPLFLLYFATNFGLHIPFKTVKPKITPFVNFRVECNRIFSSLLIFFLNGVVAVGRIVFFFFVAVSG